jgi:hypothetical protein
MSFDTGFKLEGDFLKHGREKGRKDKLKATWTGLGNN